MAKGGVRPGAGRPKGSKGKQAPDETGFSRDIVRASVNADMTPLQYMLNVMRNPEADQTRRDRMAQAAAPFVHARMADNRFGKKDAQAEAATAAIEDGWGGDLDFDRPH
jgi:hypothetical protein